MRHLRYGFRVPKLINNPKVARVGWRMTVGLQRALGRCVGRMGHVWVLSRNLIEGCLALVLVIGGQLGWDVYLMAKAAIVDFGIRRLVLVGRNASKCGLLKLVGVLQFAIDGSVTKFRRPAGKLRSSYYLQW